ncbi:oxidoreductase [Patulibacter medicamentivorans]|uniref:Oxidoreductase n=1 Tax=Patulibacter medicamentivorans TaxID=1097667 RepID=H0E045_9ACTN|nr:Gfo/Idh/MocA family oxidoreductase [Patulibacter medicamentivorans]EHN13004.1 oxidoreductase [Patulibacter medicamentivorans]
MPPVGSPERPARVLLLGYGIGGAAFHAPLIAATPGLRLAAVTTRDPQRVAEVGARYPGAAVLPDGETALASAGDFDLAVVTTPNRSHVPLARTALEAGLAVVVDKPLAARAAEAEELVALAGRRQRPLTVFQNRRWDGDLLTLRRLIADGSLGRVQRFESRFERWRPRPKVGWRELADPRDAGGVLYDLGSHLIDQALLLFGPPTSVYAELDVRRPGAAVDDDAFVALTHAGGVRSHLWASATAADVGPRLRVLGSAAAYVKHGLDVQEEQLRGGTRPGDAGYGVEDESAWGTIGTDGDRRPVATERGDYPAFYVAVAAALRGEGPVPVDPADAVAALRVVEAAQRSAATGAPVAL